MPEISASVRVNAPERGGGTVLDRDAVWAGLLRKAEDATLVVAGMSSCRVLERTGHGLVREVVIRGERVREEVRFEPKRRVSFHRSDERARWTIHNDIEEDADGELLLTFRAELDLGDGPADPARLERARAGYVAAIEATLALCRSVR
ncbi:SRPBCC family protein [Kitasatospora viridis]|uniref:Uncharacterized protein DUF1857 n=1 Tax=Kitasatospora viridis TaxID=281105 RepID=A0A561SF82_9ACTN|nr:SRPBCC family protein [Kitasatospora viridis]TWF73532.1 uncharacterized protein DUF1857 [Kitasatospora viridis]